MNPLLDSFLNILECPICIEKLTYEQPLRCEKCGIWSTETIHIFLPSTDERLRKLKEYYEQHKV